MSSSMPSPLSPAAKTPERRQQHSPATIACKMHPGGPDPVHKSLQITQDDKFYCKLLSKESSTANPSFRVYYGGASGAVPFVWESQPGTPKHPNMATTLPPLTPPPSYQFSPRRARGARKSSSKSSLLNTILPRLTQRKPRSPSPATPAGSPSSSSLSSSASSFSPMGSSNSHGRSRFSSPRSSFSSMADDDESDAGSPTSTLCFGPRHGGGFRGCYKMVIVKNALLSIVGRGSGQGTA